MVSAVPAIGVIAEYNPFHNGHAYHLRRCREEFGEDSTLICVMSGDFVQRGEAAVYSKFARAEAACRCGADVVVELPLPWCLSSAERFAAGAVSILGRLGAEVLCFGSESGDTERLGEIAQTLLAPGLTDEVKSVLAQREAISFAEARQLVLNEKIGAAAALLERPNDLLAVEYMKAIGAMALPMKPHAILRQGSGHDAPQAQPGMRSGSALRQMLRSGQSIHGEVPEAAEAVYARERAQGRETDAAALELAALSRLRMLSSEDFETLPDAQSGLGLRLFKAVQAEGSLDAIHAAVKTRRYAMSRIRRMCLCACLGVKAGMNEELPPYARVLALSSRGQVYLSTIREKTEIPLLIKAASVRRLSPESLALFTLGARAHDFFTLGYLKTEERSAGEDWRTGPFILED